MVPRGVVSTARHDDVALPIALARRDVAGQHEIRQRGERDVVRAADARFEHAAAPDRDAVRLGDIVHALGASQKPPTRPSLMLMMRQARSRMACSA